MALVTITPERPVIPAAPGALPLRGALAALLLHCGVAALAATGFTISPEAIPEPIEVVWPAAAVAAAPQPAAEPDIPAPQTEARLPVKPEPEKPREPEMARAEPEPEAPKPVAPRPRPKAPPKPAVTAAVSPAAADPAPAESAAAADAAPAVPENAPETAPARQAAAAPAAAPAPAATPAAAITPPPSHAYSATLLTWLERYRDYPRAARLRRIEGEVRLHLALDRSGQLSELSLARASGFSVLDEAALNMARRAAPYPPPVIAQGQSTVAFVVPVQFRLTD